MPYYLILQLLNCCWLVGIDLIFKMTPKEEIPRRQVARSRWPNDLTVSRDDARNSVIVTDRSLYDGFRERGCHTVPVTLWT